MQNTYNVDKIKVIHLNFGENLKQDFIWKIDSFHIAVMILMSINNENYCEWTNDWNKKKKKEEAIFINSKFNI